MFQATTASRTRRRRTPCPRLTSRRLRRPTDSSSRSSPTRRRYVDEVDDDRNEHRNILFNFMSKVTVNRKGHSSYRRKQSSSLMKMMAELLLVIGFDCDGQMNGFCLSHIDLLVDWLTDWLIEWLIDWLIDRLAHNCLPISWYCWAAPVA